MAVDEGGSFAPEGTRVKVLYYQPSTGKQRIEWSDTKVSSRLKLVGKVSINAPIGPVPAGQEVPITAEDYKAWGIEEPKVAKTPNKPAKPGAAATTAEKSYAFVTDGKETKMIPRSQLTTAKNKGWTETEAPKTGSTEMGTAADLNNLKAGDEITLGKDFSDTPPEKPAAKTEKAPAKPRTPRTPKTKPVEELAAQVTETGNIQKSEPVKSTRTPKTSATTEKLPAYQDVPKSQDTAATAAQLKEQQRLARIENARKVKEGFTAKAVPSTTEELAAQLRAEGVQPKVIRIGRNPGTAITGADELIARAAAGDAAAIEELQLAINKEYAKTVPKPNNGTYKNPAAGPTPARERAVATARKKLEATIKAAKKAGINVTDPTAPASPGRGVPAERTKASVFNREFNDVSDPKRSPDPKGQTLSGKSLNEQLVGKTGFDPLEWETRRMTLRGQVLDPVTGEWTTPMGGNYAAAYEAQLKKMGFSPDEIAMMKRYSGVEMQEFVNEFQAAKKAGLFSGGMDDFLAQKGVRANAAAGEAVSRAAVKANAERMVSQLNPRSTSPVAPTQVQAAAKASPLEEMMARQGARIPSSPVSTKPLSPLEEMMARQGARIPGTPVGANPLGTYGNPLPADQLPPEIAVKLAPTNDVYGIDPVTGKPVLVSSTPLGSPEFGPTRANIPPAENLAAQAAGARPVSAATGIPRPNVGGGAPGVAPNVASAAAPVEEAAAAARAGRLAGIMNGEGRIGSTLAKGFGTKANIAALAASLGYGMFGSKMVRQATGADDPTKDLPGFDLADFGQAADTSIGSGLAAIPIGAMFGPWGAAAGAAVAGGMGLMNALKPHTDPSVKATEQTMNMLGMAQANGYMDPETVTRYKMAVQMAQAMPAEVRQQSLVMIQNQIMEEALNPQSAQQQGGIDMDQYSQLLNQRAQTINSTALAMQKLLADQADVYGARMRSIDTMRQNYLNNAINREGIDPVYKNLLQDYGALSSANAQESIARLGPVAQAQSYLYYLDRASELPTPEEQLLTQMINPSAYGLVPASYSAPNGVQYARPPQTNNTASIYDVLGLG